MYEIKSFLPHNSCDAEIMSQYQTLQCVISFRLHLWTGILLFVVFLMAILIISRLCMQLGWMTHCTQCCKCEICNERTVKCHPPLKICAAVWVSASVASIVVLLSIKTLLALNGQSSWRSTASLFRMKWGNRFRKCGSEGAAFRCVPLHFNHCVLTEWFQLYVTIELLVLLWHCWTLMLNTCTVLTTVVQVNLR